MQNLISQNLILEETGINIKNEKSLHSSLKEWYSVPGDRFEVKIDNSIIDIVRNDLLIEVQTKNFSAISKKLRKLIKNHKVKLLYPIAIEKWITLVAADESTIIRRRKSPKKGNIYDVFQELIRIPNLINQDNFSLEVLMIKEDEIRCDDGKGSWRRKGISIKDRKLLSVDKILEFKDREDFLKLLPDDLPQPFTNKKLSSNLNVPMRKAQKITYCLRKMGLLNEVGRTKEGLLLEKAL